MAAKYDVICQKPFVDCFDYIGGKDNENAIIVVQMSLAGHFASIVPYFIKKRYCGTKDLELFKHSPTFHLCPRISIPPRMPFYYVKETLAQLTQLKNFTMHKDVTGFTGISDILLTLPHLEKFEFNVNQNLPPREYVNMFRHQNREVRHHALFQTCYRLFNRGFDNFPDFQFGTILSEAGIAERLKEYSTRDATVSFDWTKRFFKRMEGLLFACKAMPLKEIDWYIDFLFASLHPNAGNRPIITETQDLNILACINCMQLCRQNPERAKDLCSQHPYLIQELYHHVFPIRYEFPKIPDVPKREDYYDDEIFEAAVEARKEVIDTHKEIIHNDQVRRQRAVQAVFALTGEYDNAFFVKNPKILEAIDIEKMLVAASDFDGDRRREVKEWTLTLAIKVASSRMRLAAQNTFYLTMPVVADEEDGSENNNTSSTANEIINNNNNKPSSAIIISSDAMFEQVRQKTIEKEDRIRKSRFIIPKLPYRRRLIEEAKNNNNNAMNNTNEDACSSSTDDCQQVRESFMTPTFAAKLVEQINDLDTKSFWAHRVLDFVIRCLHACLQLSAHEASQLKTGNFRNLQHTIQDPCDARRLRYIHCILPLEKAKLIPALFHCAKFRQSLDKPPATATAEEITAWESTIDGKIPVYAKAMAVKIYFGLYAVHRYFDWPRNGAGEVLDVEGALMSGLGTNENVSELFDAVIEKNEPASIVEGPAASDADIFARLLSRNDNWAETKDESRHQQEQRWKSFVDQFTWSSFESPYNVIVSDFFEGRKKLTSASNVATYPPSQDETFIAKAFLRAVFPKQARVSDLYSTKEEQEFHEDLAALCRENKDAKRLLIRQAQSRGMYLETFDAHSDDEDDEDENSEEGDAEFVSSEENDDHLDSEEEFEYSGPGKTNAFEDFMARRKFQAMLTLDAQGLDDDEEPLPSVKDIISGKYAEEMMVSKKKRNKNEENKKKAISLESGSNHSSRRRDRDGNVVTTRDTKKPATKKVQSKTANKKVAVATKKSTTLKKAHATKPKPKPKAKKQQLQKKTTKKPAAKKAATKKAKKATPKKAAAGKKKPQAKKAAVKKAAPKRAAKKK